MKRGWFDSLWLIFLLFTAVMAGYAIGMCRFDPETRLRMHSAGFIPFCDLSEDDRLHLCPQARIAQKLATDGALIFYLCSSTEAYVETIDLSDASKAALGERFKNLPGNAERACGTEHGEVFHLMVKPRIYK